MSRAIDGTWSRFVWNLSESESLARKFRDGKACLIDLRLAVEAQPTLTPPNEALTEEQLREMDGEPVYIIIDGVEPLKMWALIEVNGEDIYLTNNLGGRSSYEEMRNLYKIKLYRRPPEGEEDA